MPGDGGFGCVECASQERSIATSVLAWFANFMLVAFGTYMIFMSDYTEEEEACVSDLLKVGEVGCIYFPIAGFSGIGIWHRINKQTNKQANGCVSICNYDQSSIVPGMLPCAVLLCSR